MMLSSETRSVQVRTIEQVRDYDHSWGEHIGVQLVVCWALYAMGDTMSSHTNVRRSCEPEYRVLLVVFCGVVSILTTSFRGATCLHVRCRWFHE